MNKIYAVISDLNADSGELRVIDESGEDYLFAADRFLPIELPAGIRASIVRSLRH